MQDNVDRTSLPFSFCKIIVTFFNTFFLTGALFYIYLPAICQCLTDFSFSLLSEKDQQNKKRKICLICSTQFGTKCNKQTKTPSYFPWLPVFFFSSFDSSIFFQIITFSGDMKLTLPDTIRGGISSKLVADYKRMQLSF